MTWSGRNQALNALPTQADVERMLQEAGASYTVKRVPANAVLFWEGEAHPNHYYLIEGTVEIYKVDAAYRKRAIDFYGPGAFFGFQFLTDSALPMTTARTCEDSRIIVIPRESYFKALHGSPDFADASVRYLFGLLSMQTDEVISASFYSASQRVAMLLLTLAEDLPAGSEPLLPYGNAEVAEMLGLSRNSVTASLSRLANQGIVEKRRNAIAVLDMNKLRAVAQLGTEG